MQNAWPTFPDTLLCLEFALSYSAPVLLWTAKRPFDKLRGERKRLSVTAPAGPAH